MKKVYLVFYAERANKDFEYVEVYSSFKKADVRRQELLKESYIAYTYVLDEKVR